MIARYPFTAIVGQERMQLALVLNAINPRLGGVLIRGEKGTAKSTAARGLADLLPSIDVVDGCRFACDPADKEPRCSDCLAREAPLPTRSQPVVLVELPIGATEDRVLGTLDLERALQAGERHFEPGLLARANRGLLYVDEVNLLPDHLVDALLDAAAMGINSVEREGISFSHPAAFVLIGTMNPEEGELRPQLLDRFALAVDVAGMPEVAHRTEVVRRRIAYEADPVAFVRRWVATERAEAARILAARALLSGVSVADDLLGLIARICTEFGVDGLRADIVMYKTAMTLAAYAGRALATTDDVRLAAELALPHRRRRQPFDQPGLDRERLDQVVQQHAERTSDGPSQEANDESPTGPHDDAPATVFDVGPAPYLASPDPPRSPPVATALGRSARQRTARTVESAVGRHVRSTALQAPLPRPLDVSATLLAAAPYQRTRNQLRTQPRRPRLEPHDVRFKVRTAPLRVCTLFVVDASGSMAAQRRMAAAKGAIASLLTDAYQHRHQVGMIAFRGAAAELVLPPTNSADLAYTRLRDLPTGGRTPLADALRLAHATLARHALAPALVVLVSDGRANVAQSGVDPHADALAAAAVLRTTGCAALVVDTEDGHIRLGLAHRVCAALGGTYIRLADPDAPTGRQPPLADTVRAFITAIERAN